MKYNAAAAAQMYLLGTAMNMWRVQDKQTLVTFRRYMLGM